jgi:hypothetical protein
MNLPVSYKFESRNLTIFDMYTAMKPSVLIFSVSAVVSTAQQVYITTNEPILRPKCDVNNTFATATPVYSFRDFSFTQTVTIRYATSRPSPTTTSNFAPPYASLIHLVPNLTTTQWTSYDPLVTASVTDAGNPYGNASWSAMWTSVPFSNLTRGVYSTTVQPTPIPSSELVLPPPDYFQPQGCYSFPADFMLGVVSPLLSVAINHGLTEY